MLYYWIHRLLNIFVVGDDAFPDIEVQAHHVHEDVAHFFTSFVPTLNSYILVNIHVDQNHNIT